MISQVEELNDKLGQTSPVMPQQLEQLQNDIDDLKKENEELAALAKQLKSDLAKESKLRIDEAKKNEKEENALNNANDALKKELIDLEKELEEQDGRINDIENAKDDLAGKLKEEELRNQALEEDNRGIRKQMAEAKIENDALNKQNKDLSTALRKDKDKNALVKQFEDELDGLRRDNEKLKLETEELLQEKEDLQNQVDDLEKEKEAIEQENMDKASQLKDLKQAKLNAEDAAEKANRLVDELQKELDDTKTPGSTRPSRSGPEPLLAENDLLKKKVHDLQDQLSEERSKGVPKNPRDEQGKKLNEALKDLKQAQDEIKELESELDDEKKRSDKLEADLTSAIRAKDRAEKKLNEGAKAVAKGPLSLTVADQDKDKLIDRLHQANIGLAVDLEGLKKAYKNLENQARADKSVYEKKILELQDKLEELNDIVEDLTDKLTSIQVVHDIEEHLNPQKQVAVITRSPISAAATPSDSADLKKKLVKLQAKYESLERTNSQNKDLLEKEFNLRVELEKQIRQMRDQLETEHMLRTELEKELNLSKENLKKAEEEIAEIQNALNAEVPMGM